MSEEMDRKMKDLMTRVVEMAPEAPPFPEEMVTLSPAPPQRSLRPALVFAGAAAAVLLIALPLLLLDDGEGVDPAVTTVPTPTTVPSTPTTTTAEPVGVTFPVTIYLVQDPENSFSGSPALVPVATLSSAPEGQPASLAALRALLDPALAPPPGLLDNLIPAEVAVLGVTEDAETITVDMNQAFLAGSGTGLLGDITMLNQLIYTATQGNTEAGVIFTVEGQEPGPYGTEGLLLDTAFTRDYYRDELNSVIVTTPVAPDTTELSGVARVFEATVSLEIRNAAGEVVDSQFTETGCGGCWGEYTFTLDPDLLEPGGQVRVFWHSPEDGDPSDVAVIPIPEDEDGLWDLTP